MIYAAPFIGEFGWECSVWAPWLRWQCTLLSGTESTVFCKRGHESLYEDFATKVRGIASPKVDRVDCQHAWIQGQRVAPLQLVQLVREVLRKKVPEKQVLTWARMRVNWQNDQPPVAEPCKWHRYGGEHKRELVVVHWRHGKQNPERNMRSANVLPGHVDVSVGKTGQAAFVEGSQDLRDRPLHDVIEVFARAKVVIGPSSGPLALAMLCGAPVVWWSANTKDRKRFEWAWNPFRTTQVCAAKSWTPSAADVHRAVDEVLALQAVEEPK